MARKWHWSMNRCQALQWWLLQAVQNRSVQAKARRVTLNLLQRVQHRVVASPFLQYLYTLLILSLGSPNQSLQLCTKSLTFLRQLSRQIQLILNHLRS
mmetsp:Transcript_40711/g.118793  ORF Transcript_40711/g.118793 Transcript_40711/m.118793 type:complete len:98 (+) Transcript_40711:1573-1866(+)